MHQQKQAKPERNCPADLSTHIITTFTTQFNNMLMQHVIHDANSHCTLIT